MRAPTKYVPTVIPGLEVESDFSPAIESSPVALQTSDRDPRESRNGFVQTTLWSERGEERVAGAVRPENAADLLRELLLTGDNDLRLSLRNRLLELHLPLVRAVAVTYARKTGRAQNLLESEGVLGLIAAIDSVKAPMISSFANYARQLIRYKICEYLDAEQSLILPRHATRRLSKLRLALRNVMEAAGRGDHDAGTFSDANISTRKLAEMANLRVGTVRSLRPFVGNVERLDGLQDDCHHGRSVWSEMARDQASPADAVAAMDASVFRSEVLSRALNKINPSWADIVRLHYGLNGDRALSIEEIAQRRQVSRQRIAFLLNKAIEALQEVIPARMD